MTLKEYELDWRGNRLHCWRGGAGRPLLLLHGSGPGASTVGNWARVIEPLAERFELFACDLIGFGLSGRKKSRPYFDLMLWEEQTHFVLNHIGHDDVAVLGHSLSGVLALKLAARDRRVCAVVTTGTVGAPGLINPHLERIWTFPKTRADLLAALGVLVYDKSLITEDFVDQRLRVLSTPGYGEYFDAMFGGDKRALIDSAILAPDTLAAIRQPVLMIHGLDDQPVPFHSSLTLAESIKTSDVLLLNRCSHSPALEHPKKLVSAVSSFLVSWV